MSVQGASFGQAVLVKLGLVLGAGGVVGMQYHAGTLHALAEVGGLDPVPADVIVGTSAGSVMAALLRTGWTPADLWAFAQGTHPLVAELDEAERERRRQSVFTPRFSGPIDLARRTVGSAYVLARTAWRVPAPPVPGFLARGFPGGLFDSGAREQLAEVLPEAWPERATWLVAVDLRTGQRVPLGKRGAPPLTLREGVRASCAIPGIYPPVRMGGRTLVDGGAHSTTNLDLLRRSGCGLVVAVAPMTYDPARPPGRASMVSRQRALRSLQGEARIVKDGGAAERAGERPRTEVLLVRPSREELALHGARLMRPENGPGVATAAYDAAARLLDTPRFKAALERLAA